MKFEIALISATLLLNAVTFGQFGVKDSLIVKISLANSSNDLETTLINLGVKFNKSAVLRLVLNDVNMQSGKDFFKDDHLKQFSFLETLRLENGKIDSFPISTFVNWKNAKDKNLHLINIGLKNISKDLLKPIFKLLCLNVSHNELTLLADDVFYNSPKLSTVDLSYNKLNNWPRDIFQPIKHLDRLFLTNNNISSLNEDIFSSQKANLMELDLSFNDIKHVHDKIFAGMYELTNLKISHAFSPKSNSTYLPPNLFRNLPKLRELEADHNNFQYLPEEIFSDLENLRKLNLSSNNIKLLSPKIFEKNHQLTTLNLDNNKLGYLNHSLFQNLIELEYLNLANNQLIFSYGTKLFSSLFQLQTIILDNNEKVQLAYNGSKSILYNCNYIQRISARNTNISEIYTDWYSLQNLQLLDLTNTSVGKIRSNYIFQSKYAELVLTGSSNESLILSKKKYMELDENAGSRFVLDKKTDCGENCFCVFHILYREHIIKLKCTRFDREKLPPQIPRDIMPSIKSDSYKTDFILDSCGTLDVSLLRDYLQQIGPEKVRTLSLSNNTLSSISDLIHVYPPNLEVLRLDHNNFTWLHPVIVEKLKNSQALKTITLHKNEWDCNCDSKEFIRFVKNVKNFKIDMPESEKVLCSAGLRVEHYAEEDCDLYQNELALICSVIFMLTTTFAITFVLYRKYDFYIHSYAFQYHKYLPEWVFPDDECSDDMIYDAFLCYAKDDESFIKTILVPMLEQQYPFFKLCLHQRDWDVGARINDQIYKSVRSSRRTLVVLSHNFLNSEWCKMEFEVAHNKAIEDGVNRLIVIMLEDIATHRLNEDLKAYVTKYTYIPWQDTDWFWSKLRYALPHRRRANTNTDRNGDSNDEMSRMFGMQQC